MKFKLYGEEFTSPANLSAHYIKHVIKGKQYNCSPEEYERIADDLSRTPIDNKTIFGYQSITREGRVANCKYNKATGDFVVYRIRKGVPQTITLYRKKWGTFTGDRAIEYYDEISE
jgi:hypothetical protein